MSDMYASAAYAALYDVLCGCDTALLDAQFALLSRHLSAASGPVLDAGCGTGRHLLRLGERGYCAVGVDLDHVMLARARLRLIEAGQPSRLACGDLRALPLGQGFAGILCAESPLALLPGDAGLAQALAEFHRVLRPNGVLVADVFDYVAALGERGVRSHEARFATPSGEAQVVESHRYDRSSGVWVMRQRFTVTHAGQVKRFSVRHRLHIRSTGTYASALEAAGFAITELLPAYPGALDEPRLVFVARRRQ